MRDTAMNETELQITKHAHKSMYDHRNNSISHYIICSYFSYVQCIHPEICIQFQNEQTKLAAVFFKHRNIILDLENIGAKMLLRQMITGSNVHW